MSASLLIDCGGQTRNLYAYLPMIKVITGDDKTDSGPIFTRQHHLDAMQLIMYLFLDVTLINKLNTVFNGRTVLDIKPSALYVLEL